jgi:hypothetical protein|tara:strand:- start:5152 stop:5304 length:153 start_codon:yes stop_codon:yes gene_type:complete
MKIKTSRDICLLLAVINVLVYMIGGGTIALVTSLLMLSSYMIMEIAGKDV